MKPPGTAIPWRFPPRGKCSSKWRCSIVTVRRDSLKTSWACLRRYSPAWTTRRSWRGFREYRPTGRQGYPLKALWRAYVGSFVLNLPHTNALIRRLEDDPAFRILCGFGHLPHRTTFNRFILRLSRHSELVEDCFSKLTGQIKALLPDLGEETAVDATTVRSHCAPSRKPISDPQASWTAKNSTQAKSGGKEWRHGYKVHMIADANYGLPLAHVVTTASRNDSPELPAVFAKTESLYPWFHPSAVIADRGYDSAANHEFLRGKDALPIIHIRRNPRGALFEGIYTEKGVPTVLDKSRWSTSRATRNAATCTAATPRDVA